MCPATREKEQFMSRHLFWVLCVWSLMPSVGRAGGLERAKHHEVLSPNEKYVLVINPKTNQHSVYAAADRQTPLWTFTHDCYYHVPAFLSNDGKVAAMLTAQFLLD